MARPFTPGIIPRRSTTTSASRSTAPRSAPRSSR